MTTSPLTHCISTYNNLPYLKLAIESVRKNSYYKNAPFIVHAENCTDGTNEWLVENGERYDLTVIIEPDTRPDVRGIGGGMNVCAEYVGTEYINFLHSDFYVLEDWDLELMETHQKYPDEDLWVNSFRIEPNMFKSPDRVGTLLVAPDTFGGFHDDFTPAELELWVEKLKSMNERHETPKGEGVSGLVKKSVWDAVGGNDPIFSPTSWEDMDLFLRMRQHGVRFIMPSHSIVWHFGARGSHRLEENDGKSSDRQINAEWANQRKWFDKWGSMPLFDQYGMICGLVGKEIL